MSRLRGRVVAGLALTAGILLSSVSPALADPPSGTVPASTDLVGVGSDTTQEVMDAIATGYDATNPSAKLYSWDATPQGGSVTTKVTCQVDATTGKATAVTRPTGSGAGITALLNGTSDCYDFARSSRARKTDGTEASLSFYPFAIDAVSWATNSTTNAPATLTKSQLASIYTCTARYWDQVGGKKTKHVKTTWKWVKVRKKVKGKYRYVKVHKKIVTTTYTRNLIKPYLPQTGSGTRSFFEGAIGLTDANIGTCVDQTQVENQATTLSTGANIITPYSVAKWIAQAKNHLADVHGKTVLGQISKVSPTTTSGSSTRLNTDFPTGFQRLVYNVVRTSEAAKFTAVFGANGYICSDAGVAIVEKYGFRRLGAACGIPTA